MYRYADCRRKEHLTPPAWELTRRLSGFEILNNTTLIFQEWLVSRHFGHIFHYLNFPEEYLSQFS